ncbi:MAG TPA: MerR family transcriptional regulator [Trebonia sp.]|jgi:DNA-binding transcriptional MerR regulator|nr:MerR family transcriptional regulator [Trebonia sp.]
MTYSPRLAADRSGFSLDTLRYYERVGLLYGIERTTGGQRVFSDDDLEWLSVLRCLRDTGMPIATMRRYASLARDGECTHAERLALLREHAAEVAARIVALREQEEHLHDKIGWYERHLP